MQAFVLGWCCSLGWSLVLVPIFIIKTAFRLPLD